MTLALLAVLACEGGTPRTPDVDVVTEAPGPASTPSTGLVPGPTDAESVEDAVKRHAADVKGCNRGRLQVVPELAGRVELGWTWSGTTPGTPSSPSASSTR